MSASYFIILTAITVLAGISLLHAQQQTAIAICNANKGIVGLYANPQDTLCQQ